MSREALSREISSVVSRVVSGEQVDAAERGALLAAKYPDLGMSGEMIGEAITRAAGMVGMIKSAPKPVSWPEPVRAAGHQAIAEPANGSVRPSLPKVTLPLPTQAIDADLASAIDAEIGTLVSGKAPEPTEPIRTESKAPEKAASAPASRRFAPVAALRRALFRD